MGKERSAKVRGIVEAPPSLWVRYGTYAVIVALGTLLLVGRFVPYTRSYEGELVSISADSIPSCYEATVRLMDKPSVPLKKETTKAIVIEMNAVPHALIALTAGEEEGLYRVRFQPSSPLVASQKVILLEDRGPILYLLFGTSHAPH